MGGGSDDVIMFDCDLRDDCLFTVTDADPGTLVRQLKTLAELAIETFHAHGLPLNFKKNKSEAMIKLVGKGSREVYSSIAAVDASTMQIPITGSVVNHTNEVT